MWVTYYALAVAVGDREGTVRVALAVPLPVPLVLAVPVAVPVVVGVRLLVGTADGCRATPSTIGATSPMGISGAAWATASKNPAPERMSANLTGSACRVPKDCTVSCAFADPPDSMGKLNSTCTRTRPTDAAGGPSTSCRPVGREGLSSHGPTSATGSPSCRASPLATAGGASYDEVTVCTSTRSTLELTSDPAAVVARTSCRNRAMVAEEAPAQVPLVRRLTLSL